jgi:hypothetical protein
MAGQGGVGIAFLWERVPGLAVYVPVDELLPVAGFSASILVFRDLLAVRVSPTWLLGQYIQRTSVPLTGEINMTCGFERLARHAFAAWAARDGPPTNECPASAWRLLGGYDFGLDAVAFGLQFDTGLRLADWLEARPAFGFYGSVRTSTPPQPYGIDARDGNRGGLFSLQLSLAATVLDPTVVWE